MIKTLCCGIIFFIWQIHSLKAQRLPATISYNFNFKNKSFNYIDNLLKNEKEKKQINNRETNFHFKGILKIQLLNKNLEEQLFAGRIFAKVFVISASADEIPSQTDTSLLSQVFYFTISKGNIRNIYLHKKTAEPVANTIKVLLSQIQFSIAPDTKTKWEVIQDDIYGHCNIQYSLIKKGSLQDSLIKIKNSYLSFKEEVDFNRLKTKYLPSGSTSITIDKKTMLPFFINGEEKIITQLSGKTIGIFETQFTLVRIKNNQFNPLVNANFILKEHLFLISPIYTFISTQAFSKIVRASMLGNDNIETILRKLKLPITESDEDSLYLKIKSVATIFPEEIPQLIAVLDTATINSKPYQLLWRGLLGAENKESVNALAVLIWKHRNDWDYSKKIMSNLGLGLLVTDTLVDIYKNLATENISTKIGKTAQIALGTMVDNLKLTDSAGSNELWQWLSGTIATMGYDQKSIRQKLLVWGNTNERAAFDSIITYLKSEDEEIKSIAILATCQFSFIEKVKPLVQLLYTDTLLNLKNSAAACITNMVIQKEDMEKIATIIQSEKDSSLRVTLLNCFNPATKEKKLLTDILQKIIKEESTVTVKESALAILKRKNDFEIANEH